MSTTTLLRAPAARPKLLIHIVAAAGLALSLHGSTAWAVDGKGMPGSSCQTESGTSELPHSWGEVVNDRATSTSVICPIVRDAASITDSSVYVYNNGGTLTCYVRTQGIDLVRNVRVYSTSATRTTTSTGWSKLAIGGVANPAGAVDNVSYIVCSLPASNGAGQARVSMYAYREP